MTEARNRQGAVDKSKILYAIIGLLAGFIIGFFVANSLNRAGVEAARAELSRLRAAQPAQNQEERTAGSQVATDGGGQLTDQEIRNAIATADARPGDLSLQRNLGLALYRYSSQTPNPFYSEDVVRLLKRAAEGNAKDYEVLVALGNVLFDLGQSSDPQRFSEARTYYLKALELKPDDVSTRTDLGLTYYLGRPSDPGRAISEYRRSLAIDPHHELTLQNMATALLSTGQQDEASRMIDELGRLNPSNPALSSLRAQLAQRQVKNQE